MAIGTGIEAYINISTGAPVKQVKTIAATSYDLTADDVNFVLHFTADTPVKIGIPVSLPANARFEGKQLGEGQLDFLPASGVTVNVLSGLSAGTSVKYNHWKLDWLEANSFLVYDKDATPAAIDRLGIIKLAGDLAGPAEAPTVPGKLNKGANTDYESLSDPSNIFGFSLLTRLGAIFRSSSLIWDETLKKLTIKGSQAVWEAHTDVTDGNMGIKALGTGIETFKIFDTISNFFSTGTENGKRLTRVFTAFRLVNGLSYNEAEFKAVEAAASVTTLIKTISIPTNSIVTVDVVNIAVMNTDKNYIIGEAQFSFKNDNDTVTDISIDAKRYGRQYSSIKTTPGYVINTDARIDAAISGTNVSLNFVNTTTKITAVHCEVKHNKTLMPV